jgi:hypothetical protein
VCRVWRDRYPGSWFDQLANPAHDKEYEMGTHEDRVAQVVGPALSPNEGTYATIDHPGQQHDGHQDVFLVQKDGGGNVTVEKQHTDGKSWW